jgi:pyruvate ferredoxin oxidoreductase delta subunit
MDSRDNTTQIAMSRPAKGEAGRTGDWRSKRPVLAAEVCTDFKQGSETCQRCWVYCPDACISRGVPPLVDLEYCKGCGICAEVCPSGAIEMVQESEHGICRP